MPTAPVQVLLLSGPAGVGKSTLGWEIAAQLRRFGIAHVLLDSDDLIEPRAQQRAKELLTSSAILDVAREGRSFQPVEGDGGTRASKLFTRTEPDGSMLVAAFNYDGSHPADQG